MLSGMFKKVEEILSFVSEVEVVPFHINACYGRYIVDAKSIMGMLSIGIGKNVELRFYTDENENELKKVVETFAA